VIVATRFYSEETQDPGLLCDGYGQIFVFALQSGDTDNDV